MHYNHEILTFECLHAYRRPTASLMAQMKGMVMCDMLVGLGTRLRPRARAPGPRLRSSGAVETLCVNGAKGAYRSFCMRVRDCNSYVCASLSTPNTTRW